MRLEVLSDTALRQLEPARLMTLITHVQRFIDKAVAYQRRLIAIAESQRAARAVGDACVADTLVRNTGMSSGAARRAARQAKIIARQPEVAGALACGDINTDQAEAIARADVGDEARRELVAAAVGEGTDATRERAAAAEIAARNETPEQRFMRQHANRFLRFYNNRDGMVCLEGALDPDSGARLKAKVAAIANRMWRTDKQQPPSQRRSPDQRDIDALCAATFQPQRPTPTSRPSRARGSHRPHFHTPNDRQRAVRQFDGQPHGPVTDEPSPEATTPTSADRAPRNRVAGALATPNLPTPNEVKQREGRLNSKRLRRRIVRSSMPRTTIWTTGTRIAGTWTTKTRNAGTWTTETATTGTPMMAGGPTSTTRASGSCRCCGSAQASMPCSTGSTALASPTAERVSPRQRCDAWPATPKSSPPCSIARDASSMWAGAPGGSARCCAASS